MAFEMPCAFSVAWSPFLLAARRDGLERLGEVGLETGDNVGGALQVGVLALDLVKLGVGES